MLPRRQPAATTTPLVRAALLGMFALLVCVRMPDVLREGRFWAEEGRVFFHDAWVLPPLRALFMPYGGYLNLLATASTLLARWTLPVALAPYLTIAASLAVQMVPAALIVSARDPWLRPVPVRIAALAAILLVPASEEVWLQTLHGQFHLALACALILALEAPAPRAAPPRLAILLLAPLCGPGAFAVLPLLLARALLDRRAGLPPAARLIQAASLGTGCALQLGLFAWGGGRRFALDPVVMLCILTVRHLDLPLFGLAHADLTAHLLSRRVLAGRMPPWPALAAPVCVFLPFVAVSLRRRASHPAFWLLAAGLTIDVLALGGAIGDRAWFIDPRFGERYLFVPQALFVLATLALAVTAGRWTRRIAQLALVWLLAVGAVTYRQTWPLVSHGPAWRPQVAAWRADRARPLATWPDGWFVSLPATRR